MPPPVLPWAEAPWRAWQELDADRGHTLIGAAAPMGVMKLLSKPRPIPWTAIQTWCDRAWLGAEDREMVVVLVGALDREYIAWWTERNKG